VSSTTQPASMLQVASTTQSVSVMQPASTLQVTSASQSVSMMQVTSTSQTTSMLQMTQTVQMVSKVGVALGGQGTLFWPGLGATSIGVPGSYYPSAEGRPLGGFLGYGAGVMSSLPSISPSAWTCPQTNSPTFNRPSQASNVSRPLLAVTPTQSPVKVGAQPARRSRQRLTSSPVASPQPNSSPVNPQVPPAQATPAANPLVGSCRVSFGSRAVRPGLQNSSLVTSPLGSPMPRYSTPASPSSASSPASSSPSSPSSPSSRAQSVMGMSPSHGLYSPGSIADFSNSPLMTPATQSTPAAPLFSGLRGLLQPTTAATIQQSSQSQSTAAAAPQSSTVLMRSASSKHRTLSQASQSQMALPVRGPPAPFIMNVPMLSNFSSTHVSQSSAAAPPQPSMGWSTSTISGVRGRTAHTTPAPHQRSVSLSTMTTSTTAAAPSSAVEPPQVNLLNRLLISHCFQLLVLSSLISIN